jgi:uncharacterized protein (TIGR02679 family)
LGGLKVKTADLEFFRQNPGYERVFCGILARYRSLGRLGGTVTLSNLTTEEREVLSNHLRRDLGRQKKASFMVQEFARSLEVTRFAHYSLEEILAAYFEIELTTAKEEAERLATERSDFFASLAREHSASIAGRWLRAIYERKAVGHVKVWHAYGESPGVLGEQIQTVARALDVLDRRQVPHWRLPVFASLMTTDPHAFDLETNMGTMLVDALCTVLGVDGYSSREEVGEILYGAGLLVDELSNFVTCAGLEGYQGQEIHPVWAGAIACREPLQAPLLNLSQLARVKSPWNTVFVVENPAVFAAILDAFPGAPLPPLICTAGQVKVAGLVLLNLLAREQTTIYYSGDLDPEGILIAQRLATRYPGLLNYWRFTPPDYERALSRKKLTPTRLAKLQGATDAQLKPLVEAVTRTKQAAYQELLLPDLIRDIGAWTPIN